MASWTEVSRICKALDGVVSGRGHRGRQWRVKDKLLAWERPLRASDLEELGDAAPKGDILGVRVPLEVKEALLRSKRSPYFTTSHFDGYPAVLVQLGKIRAPALKKLLHSAWQDRVARRR
jgi:hypothetical protein